MKKIFRVYTLLTLTILMLTPIVLSIDTHSVSYTIDDDVVKVKHTITTSNSINLLIPEDAYNFEVFVNEKIGEFTLSRTENYKQILIPSLTDSKEIIIAYTTSSFLEKGKKSYFTGTIRTTQKTNKLSVYLILPEKAPLARPLNALNPPVSPKPLSVGTTGRQIIINWVKENVEPGDVFSMFVVYDGRNVNLWYFIIGFITLIIISGIIYFYKKNKQEDTISKTSFPHLLEPEQLVVKALIRAKDNTMWQKELQIAVGFTKSKLSRTIRNMEQRDLVKKIPYGTTNKIELIKKEETEEEKK